MEDIDNLDISTIQISGGEPFTHPRLLDFLSLLKSYNKNIEIYTSGNIKEKKNLKPLSKSILSKLKEENVNLLRFNLQSHKKKIHNLLTGKNSFQNVIKSIKRTNDIGLKSEIHLIPLKYNYNNLDKTIEFCKNLNVSKVKILRFLNHGRGLINQHRLILNEFENKILLRNLRILKEKYDDFIEIGTSFKNNSANDSFCEKYCTLGSGKIVITPELKVYPCVATKNCNFFDFNIKTNYLTDIIHSEKYRKSILKFKDNNNFLNVVCPTQRYLNSKLTIFTKKFRKKLTQNQDMNISISVLNKN